MAGWVGSVSIQLTEDGVKIEDGSHYFSPVILLLPI